MVGEERRWEENWELILNWFLQPIFVRNSIPVSCLLHSWPPLLLSEFILSCVYLATVFLPNFLDVSYFLRLHLWLSSVLKGHSFHCPSRLCHNHIQPSPIIKNGHACAYSCLTFLPFIFNLNKICKIVPSLPQSKDNGKCSIIYLQRLQAVQMASKAQKPWWLWTKEIKKKSKNWGFQATSHLPLHPKSKEMMNKEVQSK